MRWPVVHVEDIRAEGRNALVGGPFGSDLSTKHYVEDGVPVIRGCNLPDHSAFLDDEFVYVSDDKARQLASNTAGTGDLIFTQRGTLGQVGLVPKSPRYPRYVISQSQMKLTVDESKALPHFVYYFFRLPATVEAIKSHVSSSGVPHINLGVLRRFKIPLPPLSVQHRIATILSAYDELIKNNQRRMGLLEEAARQLYQEWFVRLRFPGHERVKIKNGVPEGWERVPLSKVAEVNHASLSNSFDGEIEYIDISAVSPGSVDNTTLHSFRDAPSRARRIVQHGDIIWSCVRPTRRSYAVIWQPPEHLVASTGFAVISPRCLPTSYLLQATTTDAFVDYLGNHARGAAYPAVRASDFERAKIVVPFGAIVKVFDDIAEPMLAQTHALRLQNQKLRAARDLLLPKLMSGEIVV